jgi:hypothetical protein
MQNYQQTILSQYSNSPNLLALLNYINQWFDPSDNIDAFYNDIWNVATATGYGLDVWGRIVGVSRTLQIASPGYLGFAEAADTTEFPFNQEPFYTGSVVVSNFSLSDDAFRPLIYAKALANLTNGSTQSLNSILLTLFAAQGPAWVIDNLNMSYSVAFDFQLSPLDLAVVTQFAAIAHITGIPYTIVQFGFFDNSGVLCLIPGTLGYPTSQTGLPAGAVWSNAGVVSVVPGGSGSGQILFFGIVTPTQLLASGAGGIPTIPGTAGSLQLWNNGGEIAIS